MGALITAHVCLIIYKTACDTSVAHWSRIICLDRVCIISKGSKFQALCRNKICIIITRNLFNTRVETVTHLYTTSPNANPVPHLYSPH